MNFVIFNIFNDINGFFEFLNGEDGGDNVIRNSFCIEL